ncbi:MAG TPA: HEAT repeat domain-containing protein [Ktedonobacteraceae bacterium]|nr:HEAT repeat domain-containing protein [Ktedonobacteraceae bacterium]
MEKDIHRPDQAGHMQAPASLLAGLETRLQARRAYLAAPATLHEHLAALQQLDWQLRSAAAEALGACEPQHALEPLLETLHDENTFVRVAAIRALGKLGAPSEPLLLCLQDTNWQVRESAALTLGELASSGSLSALEAARSDTNSEVRAAVDLALGMYKRKREASSALAPLTSFAKPPERERKQTLMDVTHITDIPPTEITSPLPAPAPRHKRRWIMRTSLLAAATVVLLVALTAAGLSTGWWNTVFGNPNLYQTVQQQQTSQGVTVVVTKVYADEGRTIIAYDTYEANHDQRRQFFPDHYDVQGSAPQKSEPLTGTYGDPLQEGVTHFYMILPAFQVPAGVNTLTITWDIQGMIVNQPGVGSAIPELSGHWHFSFAVPFHHENAHQLPDPIHGQTIKAN